MVRRAGIVLAVALMAPALYLAFGIVTAGDAKHEVTLRLDPAGVSWPWHSSIQRSSADWINGPAGQSFTTSGTTLKAQPPRRTDELLVISTSPTAERAAQAANAAAEAFLAHDLLLQREPAALDVEAYDQQVNDLRDLFVAQEISVGEASNAAEIASRSTLFEGTAALLSGYENDLAEAQVRLDAVSPRYSILDSAPVSPTQSRLPETVRLAGALLLGGSVLLGFSTRRDAG